MNFLGQTESIMELEDLGANIWLKNLRGDMPLHEAAQAGYLGMHNGLLPVQYSMKRYTFPYVESCRCDGVFIDEKG